MDFFRPGSHIRGLNVSELKHLRIFSVVRSYYTDNNYKYLDYLMEKIYLQVFFTAAAGNELTNFFMHWSIVLRLRNLLNSLNCGGMANSA
jgi:hypothetical protein